MALDLVVGSPPKIDKVATGFVYTGGPVFSRRGYLLFSDVGANRILQWEGGKVNSFRQNSNGANGLTFDHQGRLLACEQGRVTRTEKDGSITVLAAAFEGARLNNPNDLVYAIDGSIYFSVIQARGSAIPGNPALYQITRKGELRVASRECTRPNGVALAANQEKLFIADTDQRNVRIFEVQGDGSLRNGRIFCGSKGRRHWWTGRIENGRKRQCLGGRTGRNMGVRHGGEASGYRAVAGDSQQLCLGRRLSESICHCPHIRLSD